MREFAFQVVGRPQGKGSKRALPVRGRPFPVLVDQNPRAKPWAGRIAAEAAGAATQVLDGELLRGAVSLELGFFFARPKSHYGSGRNVSRVLASAPPYMTAMPDVDKLARTVLDALTGVVFQDDAQVTALELVKGYGAPERLEARVMEL